ncbi:MAG: PAS domain S-box protein [Ferruginibacter sp.]
MNIPKANHSNIARSKIKEPDFSILINTIKDYAIFMTDPSGLIMTWNEGAKHIKGYEASEIIGSSISILYTKEDNNKKLFAKNLKKAKEHNTFEDEGWRVKKDGNLFWANVIFTALYNEGQQLTGYAIITKDISAQKLIQDNLEKKVIKRDKKIEIHEHIFTALIENAADAVVVMSAEGKPFYISPSVQKILGYTEEEAMQLDLFSITHPDDAKLLSGLMKRVMASPGVSIKGEARRMLHKDGSWRWLEATLINMLHDPLLNGIIDNFRDVTAIKVEEKKLINANRLYAFISQINQTIVHVKNEQTLFDEVCRIAVEEGKFKMAWIGIPEPANRKIKLKASSGSTPIDLAKFKNYTYEMDGPIDKAVKGSDYFAVNEIQKDPDMVWKGYAAEREFNAVICLAIKKSGKLVAVFNIYSSEINFFNKEEIALLKEATRDISFALEVFDKDKQRIRAEQKLAQSEMQLSLIYNNVTDGIFLLNVEKENSYKFISVNKAFLAATGITVKQVIGKFVEDVIPEPSLNLVLHKYRRVIMTKKKLTWEETTAYPSGIKTGIVSLMPVFDADGYCIQLIGSVKDITEKHESEEILRRSESNLQAIFENTSEGFILTDKEGIVKSFNNKSRNFIFLNIEKEISIGTSIFDFIHESRKDAYKGAIAKVLSGETLEYDYPYERRNGETKWFNFTVNPVYNAGNIAGLSITAADITERKKGEQQLRESESFNRGILSSLNAHIAVIDTSGLIITVNKAWNDFAKLNGVTSLERCSEGSNYFDVCKKAISSGDEIAREALAGIRSVFRNENETFEMEYPCHSAYEKRWFILRVTNFGIDGSRIVISHQNISGRKIAEELLLLSQSNLKAIIENTDASIYSLNSNFQYITFNQLLQNSLKAIYDLDIKPGDNVYQFLEKLNPVEASEWETAYSKALAGETVKFEKEFSYNDLNTCISFSIYPIWEYNMVIGLSCFAFDITKQKIAEQQIRSEKNMLRTLIDNLPDTIYFKDASARKLISNKFDYNLLGEETEDAVLGKTDLELLPGKIGITCYGQDMEILKTGTSLVNFEEYFTPKNSNPQWLLTTKLPLRNEQNKIIGLLGIGRDITEKKMADEKLNILNTELEKNVKQLEISNAELEQFAYVASHDLQEPLRMVTSFLSQIEKKYGSMLDDKGKKYIHFAIDGAKRMRQIILDLLEFSRVGQADEKKEEVDMNELVNETLVLLRKKIEEQKGVVKISKLPVLKTFRAPLRQVFQNLIGNGLIYHKKSEAVKIDISVKDEKKYWQFAVTDNGIGIDPEYFDKIFTIFQRLHNRDEYSGTGIGLAITKKIIENMGGKIWVESEEGKGSTFYFTLPK